jgi:leucyl/phenylalanyl-tRNA--protein transferase
MPVYQLTDKLVFPPPEHADPDGLLAVGGDLSMKRLLLAYRMGLFPWYAEDTPILWWSPDPRLMLKPKDLCVSKRLARTIKQGPFTITLDEAFADVIRGCAHVKRPRQKGTWIMDEMIDAYCCLHRDGYAHSVESWQDGKLVGGLYGVALGKAFFGESMFARVSDASKVAFVHLTRLLALWNFSLIDCQVTTSHLESFGAREVPRAEFLKMLKAALRFKTRQGKWEFAKEEDREETAEKRQLRRENRR